MFRKLGDALRRFMYGRYGTDQLGTGLLVLGLVLMLVSIFLRNSAAVWQITTLLGYGVLIFYIFRCYSKKIALRRKENAWFLRLTAPLRDRQHRYFRCPGCRQTVRVPRGKGRIKIACPKCGRKFEKKT